MNRTCIKLKKWEENMKKRICRQGECPMELEICCTECEAFDACPDACDVTEDCEDYIWNSLNK